MANSVGGMSAGKGMAMVARGVSVPFQATSPHGWLPPIIVIRTPQTGYPYSPNSARSAVGQTWPRGPKSHG